MNNVKNTILHAYILIKFNGLCFFNISLKLKILTQFFLISSKGCEINLPSKEGNIFIRWMQDSILLKSVGVFYSLSCSFILLSVYFSISALTFQNSLEFLQNFFAVNCQYSIISCNCGVRINNHLSIARSSKGIANYFLLSEIRTIGNGHFLPLQVKH